MSRPDYDSQPWLYARARPTEPRVRSRCPALPMHPDVLSLEKLHARSAHWASRRGLTRVLATERRS